MELITDKLQKKRQEWQEERSVCFTMDTDWASDYIIENTVRYFRDLKIPLTVFATNESACLNSLKGQGVIDVQIHPNFIQPSSQGADEDQIIDYCMNMLPKANTFRGHRWYASNDIYDKLYARGIRYESNLCTMLDNIPPFIHRSGMIAFPVFMEDGALLYHECSLNFKDTKTRYDCGGLKIIDFHPMHFMVNTPYFSYTREIKDRLSREEWNSVNEDTLEKLKYSGRGISDYIKELAEYAVKNLRILPFSKLYETEA